MKLNKEDVVALISDKEELVCTNCATDKDWDAVSDVSGLFMAGKLAEDKDVLFFCDKCETRLKA